MPSCAHSSRRTRRYTIEICYPEEPVAPVVCIRLAMEIMPPWERHIHANSLARAVERLSAALRESEEEPFTAGAAG